MLTAILFPLGVRLSTIVTAGVFIGLAVVRRDRLPLLAGAAWLTGFEAAFQIASVITGKLQHGYPAPIFFISLGAVTVWATRDDVRVDWRFLAVSIALVAVWMATGFHLNGHEQGMFTLHTRIAGFDPVAEVLNDVAKAFWALAYLLPLMRVPHAQRDAMPQASAG